MHLCVHIQESKKGAFFPYILITSPVLHLSLLPLRPLSTSLSLTTSNDIIYN